MLQRLHIHEPPHSSHITSVIQMTTILGSGKTSGYQPYKVIASQDP